MSNRTLFLTDPLYDYMRSVSLREPEILRELREETSRDPMSIMQITPEQGQLMSLLVKVAGASKALEVGVYTGYSSLCVAMALPPNGKMVACDISREWTDVARRYWKRAGVAGKITLHLAPAIETLNHLLSKNEAGTFDFMFIDGDKKGYDTYYERGLSLLRPGGLMAIDNVFWSEKVADPKIADEETNSIGALNERLRGDDRIDLSMIPIGDGLALVMKK
jgi:predicted O-methyltransferase YrrM